MPDRHDILRHTPPRHLRTAAIVAASIALVIVVLGVVSRVRAGQDLSQSTERAAIPTVSVLETASAAQPRELVLPGDIEAYYSAPVHARATGYLKRWYTDIGTEVKAGQTLAEIDTPDLDQQLAQARGNLGTAVANEKLAEVEARRYRALLAQNAIATELVDEKVGALEADVAAVAAARANVRQLMAEVSFKKISAPFDGVVTSRSTDVGALITVGTATDVPLFTVADEHRLRIYVRVPQNYAAAIKPGLSATFTVPQYPGRTFAATLATTAQAVDATSGTQLVEFQADNADRALKPGEYAQTRFTIPAQASTIVVPASVLLFREGGMSVATLDRNNRIVIKRITISRDLGSAVEVAAGLGRRDRIVDNPPDSLSNGDLVRVAAARPRAPG